jgi:hypothetical protein
MKIKRNFKFMASGSEGIPARREILMALSLIVVLVAGCASLSTTPTKTFDQLTPDEQGRVVISAIQDGSGILFDVGKGVMMVKPEYGAAWKLGVVPTFNELNIILLDLESKGSQGQQITVPVILGSVQGRISQIISTVAQYGTITQSPGSKPTPNDYGLIVVLGLSTATVAWNDIVAAMSGQIPAWDAIKARNMALQAKIDGEK